MPSESRSRSFVGHAATYAVANVARRVVGFAMLPIYTRFLTPADYGVVGLLTFALALFEPIFGARLGWAIPKFYFDAEDARYRRTVIWGALIFTGAASVVSVVALVLFRNIGSRLIFGDPKFSFVLGLFSITLLSQPIEQAGMTYIRLRERSRLFLGFSMVKLILQVSLNLLLVVYWRQGVLGVVLSTVISSVLLGVILSTYVATQEAPAFDWQVTRRMVQFCWPLWLSGLAGLYVGSSGAVYLRAFDSLSDVGRLELGLRFATVVGMLIWAPFFQHWEPMSFQYYKEKGGEYKFQIAFIVMAAAMFSVGLGISIFSGPVIRLMATKSFYPAAAVVPILTLSVILGRLRSFFNFSFMVTNHTKIQSLSRYIQAFIITGAYFLLVPTFGLLGAAIAQCIAALAVFIFVRMLSRRYYDPGFNLVPLVCFALIGVVAYVFSSAMIPIHTLVVELLVKFMAFLIAVILIALVGIRAVWAVDAAFFKSLPWPLQGFERLRFWRP